MKKVFMTLVVVLFFVSGCSEVTELNQETAENLAIEALENDYENYIKNEEYPQQFDSVEIFRTIRDRKDTGWVISFTSSKAEPIAKEIAIYHVNDNKEIPNKT